MEEMWLARDKDKSLWLYVGNNEPKREDEYWSCDDDCIELDGSLFQEVQWSDEKPTRVKLMIDK